MSLTSILDGAGEVMAKGLGQSIAMTRDLFVMLDTGRLSAEQVGPVFDEVFGQILPHVINPWSLSST